MSTPTTSVPSNRQRRVQVHIPSLPDDPPPILAQRPLPKPVHRRKRSKYRSFRLPDETVLRSIGITLGILLLMAVSFLVHLLLLPRHNLWAKLLSGHVMSKTSGTDAWNPELQFYNKVYRTHRPSSPILVVGLPKAGTSTLFSYFDCLGFYSQHWYCCGPQRYAQQDNMPSYMADCMVSNLQDHLPILDGCGDYDVYTELNGPRRRAQADQDMVGADGSMGYRPRIFLPQHYHLKELHDYAPNATWILNLRPVPDWIRSVQQVPANMLAKQLLYEAREQEPHRWTTRPHPADGFLSITSEPYRPNADFLQDFWQAHVDRVLSFVQQHPTHSLVIVNITHPEAGRVLAQDLSQTGKVSFPILEKRMRQSKDHSANTTTTVLYSRAKACWGAYNVKQHG